LKEAAGEQDALRKSYENFLLTLSELSGLLLELLDGSLVDTSALVDQVTGGGGFTRVDVADNDDVTEKISVYACTDGAI
jgi:hypothetical protein